MHLLSATAESRRKITPIIKRNILVMFCLYDRQGNWWKDAECQEETYVQEEVLMKMVFCNTFGNVCVLEKKEKCIFLSW